MDKIMIELYMSMILRGTYFTKSNGQSQNFNIAKANHPKLILWHSYRHLYYPKTNATIVAIYNLNTLY